MSYYEAVHDSGSSTQALSGSEETTSTLLDKAILALSSSLEAPARGNGEKWAIADTLAFALIARYRRNERRGAREAAAQQKSKAQFVTEGKTDLQEAINLYRQAVRRPKDAQESLAPALPESDDSTLDAFIADRRDILSNLKPWARARAVVNSELAVALQQRYHQTRNPSDLETAIEHHRTAFRLRESHNEELLTLRLAAALHHRFRLVGNAGDIDDAIRLYGGLRPGRAGQNKLLLARAQYDRYLLNNRLTELEDVIQHFRDSLLLLTGEGPAGLPYPLYLDCLAWALYDRYAWLGELEDLEEAIRLHHEAYTRRSTASSDPLKDVFTLVLRLIERHKETTDIRYLEDAIVYHRGYLLLRPLTTEQPDHSWSSTGIEEITRSHCTILFGFQPIQTYLASHPQISCSLGIALQEQYNQERKNINILVEAIGHYQDALFIDGMKPDILISLASSMVAEYTLSIEDRHSKWSLDFWARKGSLHAVELQQEIAHQFQKSGFLKQYGNSDSAQLLVNLAVALFSHFLHKPDSSQSSNVAMACLQICALGIDFTPLHRLEAGNKWATYARACQDSTLLYAYQFVMDYIGLSVQKLVMGPKPKLQTHHKIIYNHGSIVVDAVSHALAMQNIPAAISMLEQGRALLLRQSQKELASLTLGDKVVYAEYIKCVESLEKSYASAPEQLSAAAKVDISQPLDLESQELARRMHKLNEQIKQRGVSLKDLLEKPEFSTLQTAATEGPVIVVNCSQYGSHVVILFSHKHNPISLALSSTFYEDIKHCSEELHNHHQFIQSKPNIFSHVLREVLEFLWEELVGPVAAVLEEFGLAHQSRVWWCPTSYASNLPLHAAGPLPRTGSKGRRYFCDLYISSYMPTISALINARSETHTSPSERSVLVVSQQGSSLRNVEMEVETLQKVFGSSTKADVLKGPRASPEAVKRKLRDHSWAHFACHGSLKPGHPFDAAFVLHRRRLTLLDIVTSRLPNAEFAFLSACHTAELTEDTASEEVLHLAAAMHVCGFRSVVGTMWQMKDDDGPDLAREFYTYMLSNEAPTERGFKRAARALNYATKQLRKKKVALERWVNFVHMGA